MSKNRYDRVPWLFVFLGMPLPSFCVERVWFEVIEWPFGGISASAHALIDVTCLHLFWALRLVLSPLTLPCHCGSMGIVYSWSIVNGVCKYGSKEQDMCIACSFLALVHASLYLQTSFKNTCSLMKLLRIWKCWLQIIKPSAVPSERDPLCNCSVCTSLKLALLSLWGCWKDFMS